MENFAARFIALSVLLCSLQITTAADTRVNCTEHQTAQVDQCLSFYPQQFETSNAVKTWLHQPIFASNLTIQKLGSICHELESLLNCSAKLNDDKTLECLDEIIDLEAHEGLQRFLCVNVRLEIAKPNYQSCWTATTLCKFHAQKAESKNPGYCTLLNAVQTQVECALDEHEECRQVPEPFLRGIRSGVSSLISNLVCDSDVVIPEVATTATTTESLATRETVLAKNLACSETVNKAANPCLKELWGIEVQIGQIFNGTFLPVVAGNESDWKSLCRRLRNHNTCLNRETSDAKCAYQIEMHNGAIFLEHFCEKLTEKVQECGDFIPDDKMPCQEPEIGTNLRLMFANNSQTARCALYESTQAYKQCFELMKHRCAEKFIDFITTFSQRYNYMRCDENAIETMPVNSTSQNRSSNSILDYSHCSESEIDSIEQCGKPFSDLIDQLWTISNKNVITAIVNKLKEVAKIVKQGCDLRPKFQQCVLKVGISQTCSVMSCSVKVGDLACREETATLEKDIRCVFSLFSTAPFQQCLKTFPKNAFANFASAKPYFGPFIACIEQPIRNKCGERSWRMARAFASKRGDASCTLDFQDPSLWTILAGANATVVRPIETTTATTVIDDDDDETTQLSTNSTLFIVEDVREVSAPSGLSTPWCKPNQKNPYDDCVHGLGDLKPIPLMIFEEASRIDKACPLYSGYQNCLRKTSCTHPLAEAYKALLYGVCTTHYDLYKKQAYCLRRATYNPKVQSCLAKYQSTDLISVSEGLGQLACATVQDLLRCSSDTIDEMCGADATDMLYNLYSLFARKYLPTCAINRTLPVSEFVECSRQDRAVYYQCRNQIRLNPVSMFNGTKDYNDSCSLFHSNQMQKCFNSAPCTPQPAHDALNETMAYVCLTELRQNDFHRFGDCLSQAANSGDMARQCISQFDQIIWDDPTKVVCKKLNQAMDCSYHVIAKQKCHPDSLQFVFDVFSLMAKRYRFGCLLKAPDVIIPTLGTLSPMMPASMHTFNISTTTPSFGVGNKKLFTTWTFGLVGFVYLAMVVLYRI